MRLVYLSSVFLTITVCSIASNNAVPLNGEKQQPLHTEAVTTAVPPNSTNAANSDAISNTTIAASSIATTTPVNNVTTVANVTATATIVTNTTKNGSIETTTPSPTNAPTKAATTTKKPQPMVTETTEKPTNSSVAPSLTTSNQTVVTPSVTTAVPILTKATEPHQGRQFDGLSFVGGIILIVCLIAIATFSYKFYKPLSERYYCKL